MEDYFFANNALSESCIADIYAYMARSTQKKRIGLTGNRVNVKHKNRYDVYVSSEYVLKYIDKNVFENWSKVVKERLGKEIIYREEYKVGVYEGEDNSFYNIHTDDARETKYRNISMVLALSHPDQYEGGKLEFPDLNLSLKLEFNTAIFFKSSLRHKVTNVTGGTRNVLITFFFDEEGGNMKQMLKAKTDPRTLKHYTPIIYRDMIANKKSDVDYSDNTTHSWTDNDSSWFVNNNSDVLIVSFSGFGVPGSKPTFIFSNFLKSFGDVDQLYLRDLYQRWYLDKIIKVEDKKRCDILGIQNIKEWILDLVSHKKYKRIIAIGCSSGAFAAILYSSLLKFDKCIAFAPQTVITEEGRSELNDSRFPKTSSYIQKLLADTQNYKFMDLKNIEPMNTDIHYGEHSEGGVDARHAKRLESTCNLYSHDSKQHMIALELRNSGMLRLIMSNALLELKESIRGDPEKISNVYENNQVKNVVKMSEEDEEEKGDNEEEDESVINGPSNALGGNDSKMILSRERKKPSAPFGALGSGMSFERKTREKVKAPDTLGFKRDEQEQKPIYASQDVSNETMNKLQKESTNLDNKNLQHLVKTKEKIINREKASTVVK